MSMWVFHAMPGRILRVSESTWPPHFVVSKMVWPRSSLLGAEEASGFDSHVRGLRFAEVVNRLSKTFCHIQFWICESKKRTVSLELFRAHFRCGKPAILRISTQALTKIRLFWWQVHDDTFRKGALVIWRWMICWPSLSIPTIFGRSSKHLKREDAISFRRVSNKYTSPTVFLGTNCLQTSKKHTYVLCRCDRWMGSHCMQWQALKWRNPEGTGSIGALIRNVVV